MLLVHPPFALFSLVELPVETIDQILQKAFDGSTINSWLFYLVTGDYASAPQRKPYGTIREVPGTKAPIDRNFRSPFIGQDEMAAAEWVKKKPKKVNLDSFFFALLDHEAETTGSVVLCRIGDGPGGPSLGEPILGPDAVKCLLNPAETAGLFLAGMDAYEWENLISEDSNRGEYYPDV